MMSLVLKMMNFVSKLTDFGADVYKLAPEIGAFVYSKRRFL